mgnify:CR=1 FL=1
MNHLAVPAVIILVSLLTVILILYIKSQRMLKSLRKQLNAGIEDDKRKTAFFYKLTHDLKTPLSVIMGAVQLIESRNEKMPQDEYVSKNLRTVKQNCIRMLRLINNLLDLARSEAGYLALNPVNCDLNMFLEEMVSSVQPYAEKKGLKLYCRKSPEQVITALDIEKTERIVLNLLSNAIKFTKPGGTVTVSSYSSGGRACISVRDSGIGIPADKQSKIFQCYEQAGHCPSAEKEGSGIGLSLVKTFVEMQQGNIKIISEENKGTEFIIDFPIRSVETSPGFHEPADFRHMFEEDVKIEFSGGQPVST